MKKQILLSAVGVSLISLGMAGSADAALFSRLGGQAYYDDVADLTWLADANASQTSGFDTDGRMTWTNANNWAANLNIAGVTDWRLPDTFQPDSSCSGQSNQGPNFPSQGIGTGCTGSEMGNLFYNVLGGEANTPISSTHNANYDLFSNVQSDYYWSGAEFAPSSTFSAWSFRFGNGDQFTHEKIDEWSAWAVQSGDVAVPVPAAVWLFGSGLLGLIGIARRKKA